MLKKLLLLTTCSLLIVACAQSPTGRRQIMLFNDTELGKMGAQTFETMKAETPISIVASGGKFANPDDAAETPDTLTTIFQFKDFNLQWEHATGINGGPYNRDHGVAFIGNNGTLVLNRQGWEVIPERDKGKDKIERVELQKPADEGLLKHTSNFLDVVQSRKFEDLNAPITTGAHIAQICQMGNIAYKLGKKIYWDAEKNKFTDSEANKHLAAEYHNGYKLPSA